MRGSVGSCVALSILVLILENKESHWCFPVITVLGAGDSRKTNKKKPKRVLVIRYLTRRSNLGKEVFIQPLCRSHGWPQKRKMAGDILSTFRKKNVFRRRARLHKFDLSP